MHVFIQVVLPVLLIFLTGFTLQKWKRLDIRSISMVAVYALTPCLVFRTFYQTKLDVQVLNMVVFSFLLLLILLMVNKVYAKLRNYPLSVENGLILSTAFMNSGNYGAPIILFAFGTIGFDYSVTLLVLHAIIMNFFGVYYAARGKAGIRIAIKSVLEMPATYAVVAALALRWMSIQIPDNLFSVIGLLADAAIPLVMLVLGMQLAEIRLNDFRWEQISYGVAVRMFLSPLIALLIVAVIPMDPLLEKVLIVTAAMPSAATTVLYAIQFDTEPQLVSSITFVTTLVSIGTITALLAILA